MKLRLVLFTALMLLAGGAAQGSLKAVEQALELSLSQVALPSSQTGSVVVRRCPGCAPEILRFTPETQCFIRPARTPVTLAETRAAAGRAAGRRQASVYLYFDPKTRNVRRLVLDPAA
jgi:hypothetical protein